MKNDIIHNDYIEEPGNEKPNWFIIANKGLDVLGKFVTLANNVLEFIDKRQR